MTPKCTLNDSNSMPILGLGTWQATFGRDAKQAVLDAIAAGYRLIDTAAAYGNEQSVGQAITESDVDRSELFITTKLWNADHGYRQTIKAFHKSRRSLGLEYVDLYLIHWPLHNTAKLLSTWRAFEYLQRSGFVRSIGVSNFSQQQLELLLLTCKTPPAVNQVEVHPQFPQTMLREFCQSRGIIVESWSPLGGSTGGLLSHPVIVQLASKHRKQPAQVIIRWHIQNNLIAIPKSTNTDRIDANIHVFNFTLDESDMAVMATLESAERIGADPQALTVATPTWLVQAAHRLHLVHW